MQNIKPQVLKKLEEISNVEVSFFYPQDWIKLPAISYYEISNTETSRADDDEYQSEIAIQIDIWAKSSSETSKLALQVNDKMQELDFIREFAMDLFENVTKIYHKTMRFVTNL